MSTWSLLDDKECWERIEALLQKVPDEANRKLIKKDSRSRKAKAGTKGAQISILVKLADWAGDRHLLDLDEDDIADYFAQFLDQKETTQYHKFVAIRGFYRRVTKQKEPEQIGDFVVARPAKKRIDPKTLVSPEVMRQILAFWDGHPTEAAFFAFLYDSGFRLQEAFNLDVDSLEFKDDVVWVHLPDRRGNKTGTRTVMLVDCIPYLNNLIAKHPAQTDLMVRGEDRGVIPLFVKWSTRHKKWMRPNSNWATYRMDKTKERFGIKVLHPHLFRHTAATNMAKRGVQEGDMRRHFGWSYDSDEPAHYAHLTMKNYETSMRRLNGLAPLDEEAEEVLSARCHCGTLNRITDTHCIGCTKALGGPVKHAEDLQEKKRLRDLVAREALEVLPDIEAYARELMESMGKELKDSLKRHD